VVAVVKALPMRLRDEVTGVVNLFMAVARVQNRRLAELAGAVAGGTQDVPAGGPSAVPALADPGTRLPAVAALTAASAGAQT
jgi:hypothetical protein